MIEALAVFLLILCLPPMGIVLLYLIMRLSAKALFKGYFEEKTKATKNFLKGDEGNGKSL